MNDNTWWESRAKTTSPAPIQQACRHTDENMELGSRVLVVGFSVFDIRVEGWACTQEAADWSSRALLVPAEMADTSSFAAACIIHSAHFNLQIP